MVAIEKYEGGKRIDRWIGARYGPRKGFEEYVRRTGLQMGQLEAKKIIFLADGAKNNWEIRKTNFAEALEILDFYHASEHLAAFCDLFGEPSKGTRMYKEWRTMFLESGVLQVLVELKAEVKELTDSHKGWGHINYFKNNIKRMNYKEYRDQGYPIGSGVVEGACKFVIGKRFKGSGMRWKKADNEKVLKARLAKLNGLLADYFAPKPQDWTAAA